MLGYKIARFESFELILTYSIVFAAFLLYNLRLTAYYRWGIASAVAFRLVLFVSFPELSTDVYRFLWDGGLLTHGLNPYEFTPEAAMASNTLLNEQLYEMLSYKIYYSMYPPFTQLSGWMAAAFGGTSMIHGAIILRCWVLLGEMLTLYVMAKLLNLYKMDRKHIFWFALNPLVILELTGNLHHEAYLILFTISAIYFLERNKLGWSAVALGMGVLSKLLPILFLPLFARKLSLRQWPYFGILLVGVVAVGFLPFYNEKLFYGYFSSGALYFQKLEFNASIYFLVREVGFWVKGYNIIHMAGMWLAVITTLLIFIFSFFYDQKRVSLAQACMWVWFVYIAFTTTLHPWYILPLLAFAVFTKYRFAVVWSYLIFLTYSGYGIGSYQETPWIFIVEYVVVFGYLIWELRRTVARTGIRPSGMQL
jgi:hypothetical protein